MPGKIAIACEIPINRACLNDGFCHDKKSLLIVLFIVLFRVVLRVRALSWQTCAVRSTIDVTINPYPTECILENAVSILSLNSTPTMPAGRVPKMQSSVNCLASFPFKELLAKFRSIVKISCRKKNTVVRSVAKCTSTSKDIGTKKFPKTGDKIV